MNTKSSEISSGLVAVCWRADWLDWHQYHDLEYPLPEKWDDTPPTITPLVRLSDAEAIIAQKDAELAQLSLYKNLATAYGLSAFADMAEQADRIKELETEFAGCSSLLDNAERIMEQQSAALKLAKERGFCE